MYKMVHMKHARGARTACARSIHTIYLLHAHHAHAAQAPCTWFISGMYVHSACKTFACCICVAQTQQSQHAHATYAARTWRMGQSVAASAVQTCLEQSRSRCLARASLKPHMFIALKLSQFCVAIHQHLGLVSFNDGCIFNERMINMCVCQCVAPSLSRLHFSNLSRCRDASKK